MTSENSRPYERHSPHLGASPLSTRNRAVVELVGQFGQATAGQIGAVLFAGLASQTPLDRCLRRLVERRYLMRLTRPVGGDGGGSAQFIYQLGRLGWRLLGRPGEYWAPRSVNLHRLAVVDCFVALRRAEQAGRLTVLQFVTEPACHQSVAHVLLTPDAYVVVGLASRHLKCDYFLEVDRGTEHASVIQDKCQSYWHGFLHWRQEYFPIVVFVVPDERRQRAIERVIAAGPSQAQALFRTCTMATFPQIVVTE